MNNNNNQPPFKVVCITGECPNSYVIMPKKGEVVTVEKISEEFPCSYHIKEYPLSTRGRDQAIHKRHFVPYNPYSNDLTRELAEKALDTGDKADMPVKKIETVNN